MGFLESLFKPRQAHRAMPDYTSEAEAMYRRVASDLGLNIVKNLDDPVELSMTFPKQEKLRTDVWVCLQNLDELWFVIDGFTCSRFPFEEVKDEFEKELRACLSGQHRIRQFIRRSDGKIFKSFLQKNVGGKWITTARYGKLRSLFPIFLYDVRDEFLSPEDTNSCIRPEDRHDLHL